jgi:putative membrane protein
MDVASNPQKSFLVFHVDLKHFAERCFRDAMQSGTKKFLNFLQSWLINTLAVLVAVVVLRGHITYQRWSDLFIASLLLGILNSFVRPILMLVALPLLIFTLGLFTLVINALLLYFVGVLMGSHFQVDSFGFAFLGALIISVVSILLNIMTGNSRVSVQRRPPPKRPGDGDGPTIDV